MKARSRWDSLGPKSTLSKSRVEEFDSLAGSPDKMNQQNFKFGSNISIDRKLKNRNLVIRKQVSNDNQNKKPQKIIRKESKHSENSQKKSFFQKIQSGEKMSQSGSKSKKGGVRGTKSSFHSKKGSTSACNSPNFEGNKRNLQKNSKFKISKFQGSLATSKVLNQSSIAQSQAEVAAMRESLAQSYIMTPEKTSKKRFQRSMKRRKGMAHVSPEQKRKFVIKTKKLSQSVEINRRGANRSIFGDKFKIQAQKIDQNISKMIEFERSKNSKFFSQKGSRSRTVGITKPKKQSDSLNKIRQFEKSFDLNKSSKQVNQFKMKGLNPLNHGKRNRSKNKH